MDNLLQLYRQVLSNSLMFMPWHLKEDKIQLFFSGAHSFNFDTRSRSSFPSTCTIFSNEFNRFYISTRLDLRQCKYLYYETAQNTS